MQVFVVYGSDDLSTTYGTILGVFQDEKSAVNAIANLYGINPVKNGSLQEMCDYVCESSSDKLEDCHVHYSELELGTPAIALTQSTCSV